MHYFLSKNHSISSLFTRLINKRNRFQSSIRKLNTRSDFAVERKWVSKERRLDWSLLEFLAERLYLLTLCQSPKVECPHSCNVGGKRCTDRRSAETGEVWRGLHHLVLGSGESYEMDTIHHRARPPSPFEGARTTEIRLDRHRGCSCAVVASSPTLAFFLSHPSRESAPPLLSAKLCLDPFLYLLLFLSFSLSIPSCPLTSRTFLSFSHSSKRVLRLSDSQVAFHVVSLLFFISLDPSFFNYLRCSDVDLIPYFLRIRFYAFLPFAFWTNVFFFQCRYFSLLLFSSKSFPALLIHCVSVVSFIPFSSHVIL